MNRKARDFWFVLGWVIGTLISLCIFPGVHIAAYFFLRPLTEFWQKLAFIGIEIVMAAPLVWGAILFWVFFTGLWIHIWD